MASLGIPYRSERVRLAEALAGLGSAIARRWRLLRRSIAPDHAHSPPLKLFFAELGILAEPIARKFRPPLPIAPSANPRVVILLPGFGTGPSRMRYMAEQLERAGHIVKRWGQGFNFGPSKDNFQMLSQRVCEVSQHYGQPVVLVGWSLGGVFAREVAKLHPDCVEKVITLGSPFSHTPFSNNVWRLYQIVAGHAVDAPPVEAELKKKPPVETIAYWSPRDGIVSHRSACGCQGERDRAVALRCTHLGFSNSPEVIMSLVRELAA